MRALILPFEGIYPTIADDVFVAPNATIIGKVTVGAAASVWYGAVIRGDSGRITIGARCSVQDNVVVHVNGRDDTVIGDDVTLGHGAVVEGCDLGRGVLVGMNATVLSGSKVGAGSLIAAGAVVLENAEIAPNSLVAGVPARVLGKVSAELQARLADAPLSYIKYGALHKALNEKEKSTHGE